MKKRHVIIVGGGASGMVAAISAAREGAKVTIIACNFRFTKKRAIYSCGGKQKILCGCGNFGDRW